jgi:flap endonuclease-1
MGIHNLNPFLKTKAKDAFRKLKTELFRGTRIAIDTPLWAFAAFSSAYSMYIVKTLPNEKMLQKNPFDSEVRDVICGEVFERARTFVNDLIFRGITPVFIFDGTAVPEKSSGARQRRKERRESLHDKIEKLRQQILDADPIFRRDEDFNALRSLHKQIPPVNPFEDFRRLRQYLSEYLGVPTLTAPDEAEKYCSFLARTGYASAAWTTDTDAYLFGTPIVITGFKELKPEEKQLLGRGTPTHFSVVCVPLLFERLKLSKEQFIDMCIIFGCDFNTRIPKVGPAKAFSLIQDALKKEPNAKRLIEVAGSLYPDLPWENLNAERCREIFLKDETCEEALSQINIEEDMNMKLSKTKDERLNNTILRNYEHFKSPKKLNFTK